MKLPNFKKIEQRIAEAPNYHPDPAVGLSKEEVEARIKAGLNNKTRKTVTKSYGRIVYDNLFNFFNILLIIIFVFMLIGGLPWSSYFFMLILVANSLLGLIQDIKARHLVDKLKVVTEPRSQVVRSGTKLSLSTNEIVLSDILFLQAGDQIPADAVVVEGGFFCDESLLTGESIPVKKMLADSVLSGSFLTSGSGKVQVQKVGEASYAESLQSQARRFNRPKSEIKTGISQIFTVAGLVSIFVGILMTITFASQHDIVAEYRTFIESASGAMVALIPAGMYLLTSLTLAVGVINLARRRMLVQELYCIEMLARVDVVCFDKTGTLTDGTMALEEIHPVSSYSDEEIKEAIRAVVYGTGDANSTALALKKALPEPFAKKPLAFIPFSSDVKFSAASYEKEGTYILGAPNFVDARNNDEGEVLSANYARGGFRVLGLYKNKRMIENDKLPSKSDLIALVVLRDHIKEDAAANIAWFKNNGVAVRIISGDNPITVSQIANKVGVEGAAHYVDCYGKSEAQLIELAKDSTVFGRVTPEQKEILIKAYQREGHKVAMTGDGVNDILALKAADCSIAMASGSAAARTVSHLVSLDNDFSKLPDVVDQGRRVINNLQRTCSLFLSKTFFAMTCSIAFLIASWVGWGHGYPFSTNNMYVWEIVTIGFAAFFLALQPSHERLKGSFIGNILVKAIPGGLTASLAVLAVFLLAILWPQSFVANPEILTGPGLSQGVFNLARSLSVVCFSFVSLFILFRVCWPFNTYRGVLYVIMLLLAGALFTVDFFNSNPQLIILGISWNGGAWSLPLVGGVIVVALGGVYFLLDWLIRLIANKASGGWVNED